MSETQKSINAKLIYLIEGIAHTLYERALIDEKEYQEMSDKAIEAYALNNENDECCGGSCGKKGNK